MTDSEQVPVARLSIKKLPLQLLEIDDKVESPVSGLVCAEQGHDEQARSKSRTPKSTSNASTDGTDGVNGVLLPSLANRATDRLMVISAGQYGKSPRRTPRKTGTNKSGSSQETPVTDKSAKSTVRTPTRDLDRLRVESLAPPRFICPISGRVMRDPIILASGTSCDRGAFERWLAKGNKQDPVTKRPLRKPISTTPNVELREQITVWARNHALWLLDKRGDLVPNEPRVSELQGIDPQYVQVIMDEDEDNPPNRPSPRIESESKNQLTPRSTPRTQLRDKNGKPVPHSKPVTVMAWSGEIEKAPWSSNESTAATIPRQTKSASGRRKQQKSGLPSDVVTKRITSSFFALVTLAHLGLLLAAFGLDGWKASPMSVNPWYSGPAGTLARVGALALPLLESPAFQWWRVFSSPFVPAGAIHFGVAVVGLWTFGMYSRKALPLAYITVPATYILSATFGMLLSVNLNALYVVCGAWSGVAGLLGCVIIDQVLNWKRKKLLNLREWWLTAMILIMCAASLLTFSALPVVGLWGTLGGLWTGLLFTLSLLVIPKAMRKSNKTPSRQLEGYWRVLQVVSSIALVGSFIAVIVGVALPNKLGETVPSLRYASCSTFGGTLWECTPFGFLASGCGVTIGTGGTRSNITCSITADSTPIPSSPSGPALLMNGTAIQWLCERYCPNSTSPSLPARQPVRSPQVSPQVSPGPLLIPVESLFPPTTSPSPSPSPPQSVSLIQTGRKLRAGTYAVY